jgi:hypothetical protein
LVFGGVEYEIGKTFLVIVHSQTTETLIEIIKERVLTETTIFIIKM